MVIPVDLALNLSGVVISPVRVAMIVLFLPALAAFATRSGRRLFAFDVLFFAFSLWTGVAMLLKYGVAQGMQSAGQFVLETLGVYLLVQGFVRNTEGFRRVIRTLFMLIAILVPLAFIEAAILKEHYLINTVRMLIGAPPLDTTHAGERLGMQRVTSVFSHPILYGVFCATAFSMVWYAASGLSARIVQGLIVALATFFSLSSAPLLVLAVQFATIAVERVTRGIPGRLNLIMCAAGLIVLFLNLFTGRGLFGVMVLLTFSPDTAFYRRLIFEHGIDDVFRSPLFGIDPATWTRPAWMTHSIDNFYIVQALQGGVPSVIFLLTSIVLLIRRLFRLPDATVQSGIAPLRRGWVYSTFALVLCGATVHFFGTAQPYFAFIIALGAALVRIEAEAVPSFDIGSNGGRKSLAEVARPSKTKSASLVPCVGLGSRAMGVSPPVKRRVSGQPVRRRPRQSG